MNTYGYVEIVYKLYKMSFMPDAPKISGSSPSITISRTFKAKPQEKKRKPTHLALPVSTLIVKQVLPN